MSDTICNNAFEKLPLSSILPAGWLKDQLIIQANGFTGHLEEHWQDVGPQNGWIGGQGESWERGPYYLDGLVPLAYSLQDQKLINKAGKWIEWALNSQRENGSFGPEKIETVNEDVDKQQDWWHYMIMLKVLIQYEEASDDPRVEPFIDNFLTYMHDNIIKFPLKDWAKARGGELLLCISWLYKRNKKEYLRNLADVVIKQTINWTKIFRDFPIWRRVETWNLITHVVNIAMGIKMPGAIYELKPDEKYKEAVLKGINSLMTYHGQAHGMFSGDEWLSGTHPSQGIELCAIVEYMYSLEELVRIFGDGRFGDILEKVAYNALPASISTDWTAHQYDQQVNQIICNTAPRNWSNGPDANLFGLEPHFGCCTANMHQGWPKLCSNLWMSDRNKGLAAISYAPCIVRTKVGLDSDIEITVRGEYPFRNKAYIDLSIDSPENFAISLRIPSWSKKTIIIVNNEKQEYAETNGFAKIERLWSDGDSIELQFQFTPQISFRNMYAGCIERGPLVFSLPIKEDWRLLKKRELFHDWEVYPASQWQYGIMNSTDFKVKNFGINKQPFDASSYPISIKVKGKFIREWQMKDNSADAPPMLPDTNDENIVELELVPYGCARLRICEFPILMDK